MLPTLRATISEQVAAECVAHYGRQLRAVILTGSLARDEATATEDQGLWRLLGDAEFLVVFHESGRLPSAADVEHVRRQLEDSLARISVEGHVSLSTVHPGYLRKLKPHIFAYELKACGRVIWGDPEILSLIPIFSPADIPLEDAWRLLCNRMIEQLEVVHDLNDAGEALRRRIHYPTIKLYLDMVTSYLLFAGAYEPTYRARARRLRDLADAAVPNADIPFPLAELADRVTACTSAKLSGLDSDGLVFDQDEGNLGFWEESLAYARQLWRWELRRLTGLGDHVSDRVLWQCWMERQPVREKLRGWLSVLRRLDGHGSWRDWARWGRRSWHASPRYWVYAAASELCFRLPTLILSDGGAGGNGNCEELFRFLPETRQAAGCTGRPGWQALASEILWNYHRFLAETRA